MQTARFVLVWLAFMAVASAQNYYPKKDVAFGHVAVGDGFETVINLTNRGTFAYVGILKLFRGEERQRNTVVHRPWTPVVTGAPLENGGYEIEIEPQATVTLRLTGSQLESGAAALLSDDFLLDNLIEANLTYLVRKSGRVSDSVGISPSKEFYRSSIPFEKFAETALALVNGNTTAELTARVDLTLYSAGGGKLKTETIALGPRSHQPRFLPEFFPGQTLDRGKIEITSDARIFGTALTFKNGQFSSLPLEPAPATYSVRLLASGGSVATGELALWAEGPFIRGYLEISALDGDKLEEAEISLVNGELEDGFLRLAFTILRDPFYDEEVTMSLGHDQFSFDSTLVSGKWIELFSDETTLPGTYELTRRESE